MNYEDRVTKGYIEDALAACGNCRIFTGSYVGTGTHGESGPNVLTFPFEPKFVWIGAAPTHTANGMLLWHPGVSNNSFANSDYNIEISQSGNTLSWYNGKRADYQLNSSGSTYRYIALG